MQNLAWAFAPAAKADRAPRNPYLGYGASVGGYSFEVYPNSPAGWLGASQYNVWARNCINARMSFVSKANLKLWRDVDGHREEIIDHPVLSVLREVNPINANRKSFRRQIENQLCVFGRAIVLKVGGYSGAVTELYLLSRQLVEIIPDPDRWIAGYRWIPTGQVYAPDEIIDFCYSANDGTPSESSPTSAAVGAITRYALSDMAQAAIDKRGGQGGGIVFYPDNLDPKEFDALKQSWENIRSNPNNAGRDIHVSAALKYESGALTARDMQREERASRLMKEIMAAYQVPPAMAGDYSDASVLANADAQMSAFAEQWGVEELEFIEEAFNNQLLWAAWPQSRDDGLYLAHDLSEIPALREDEQEREQVLQTKMQTATIGMAGTLISLNEARQMIGQPAIADPRANAVPMVEPAHPDTPQQGQPAQDAQSADMPSDGTQMMGTQPAKARRIIADYVGVKVKTPAGEGLIEKVLRFGEHEGKTATKGAPLFMVNSLSYTADELEVIE